MRQQKSQKSAIRCDIKRHKATFSQKVLTILLFRPKFLLETVTNKGVVSVRREGGKSLNSILIIQVVQSLFF